MSKNHNAFTKHKKICVDYLKKEAATNRVISSPNIGEGRGAGHLKW